MAAQRFSQLHKRTQRRTTSSHQELVEALAGEKSPRSRSLRALEKRGWVVIHRTSGGKAESLYLTSEDLQRASEIGRKLSLRHRTRKNNVLWVENPCLSQPVYTCCRSCLKERHIVRRVSAFNRRKYPLTERMSWHGLGTAGGERRGPIECLGGNACGSEGLGHGIGEGHRWGKEEGFAVRRMGLKGGEDLRRGVGREEQGLELGLDKIPVLGAQ